MQFKKEGIDTELMWLGNEPVAGCIACGSCFKTGRCFRNDAVNELLEKAQDTDGFVFGSPVHFAGASGAITSFLDRVFYASMKGSQLAYKPGAAVVSARRSGTTAREPTRDSAKHASARTSGSLSSSRPRRASTTSEPPTAPSPRHAR